MDKNKIIEAAAKLVAKGAYDKAIKEYQKVLDADPKDGRVLQKMGELFQKKNDNVQAAFYFTKVAEGYSADGFFLKAVALYKQVLKLNPNLLEVNLKLAELHQQLGLMSEAMAYFQIVANHYDKAGDVKNSLDTLKKMVDLDPENVASKIKLAELYARENMAREAAQEFKKAAEYLKRNNRMDDWFRVAERPATLEPENVALAKDLAQQYLARETRSARSPGSRCASRPTGGTSRR
ncbi:tetratricopeptide repeat protein [Cystobacter fuscus]